MNDSAVDNILDFFFVLSSGFDLQSESIFYFLWNLEILFGINPFFCSVWFWACTENETNMRQMLKLERLKIILEFRFFVKFCNFKLQNFWEFVVSKHVLVPPPPPKFPETGYSRGISTVYIAYVYVFPVIENGNSRMTFRVDLASAFTHSSSEPYRT